MFFIVSLLVVLLDARETILLILHLFVTTWNYVRLVSECKRNNTIVVSLSVLSLDSRETILLILYPFVTTWYYLRLVSDARGIILSVVSLLVVSLDSIEMILLILYLVVTFMILFATGLRCKRNNTLCSITFSTGWRRPIGCLQSQVLFRKRDSNYRARLRKTTYKDKASYDSTPPCSKLNVRELILFVVSW